MKEQSGPCSELNCLPMFSLNQRLSSIQFCRPQLQAVHKTRSRAPMQIIFFCAGLEVKCVYLTWETAYLLLFFF